MWWSEFERQVPDFAHEIRERLEGPGIVLVGTTRRDGSSRISPVEAVFERGQLYFDMMWRSQKALDLLQDQRIEVHAAVADPDAPQHKVRGRVEETHDAEELEHFAAVTQARFGWSPYERHHLFRLDIRAASAVTFGQDAPEGYLRVRTWSDRAGYAERGPIKPLGQD